jgi:hypothetical protein
VEVVVLLLNLFFLLVVKPKVLVELVAVALEKIDQTTQIIPQNLVVLITLAAVAAVETSEVTVQVAVLVLLLFVTNFKINV